MVVATGMETQMGQIAGLLLESGEGDTPLQKRMGEISRSLRPAGRRSRGPRPAWRPAAGRRG